MTGDGGALERQEDARQQVGPEKKGMCQQNNGTGMYKDIYFLFLCKEVY